MTTETVALDVKVLEQAKNVLTERGWTRNTLLSCDTGEVCALGALTVALGATVEYDDQQRRYWYLYPFGPAPSHEASQEEWKAYNQAEDDWEDNFERYDLTLRAAVDELSGGVAQNVPDWNDYQAKTVDDVVRVFDLAIEKIKESK